MRLAPAPPRGARGILLLGDLLGILGFVVIGMDTHDLKYNYATQFTIIVAPLLLGWFVAASIVGAYRVDLLSRPGAFMLRSALAWLLGLGGIGLGLRATVFNEGFVPVFALVMLGFTGAVILGYRGVYTWLVGRRCGRGAEQVRLAGGSTEGVESAR